MTSILLNQVLTHRIKRSPNALGEEGFAPISFSFWELP